MGIVWVLKAVLYGTGSVWTVLGGAVLYGTIYYKAGNQDAIRLVFLFDCWDGGAVYVCALGCCYGILFFVELSLRCRQCCRGMQTSGSQMLERAELWTDMMELISEWEGWRGCINSRRLPWSYDETPRTRSGFA